MSDRYLIVLGNRLLCLPSDAIENGLREGEAISGHFVGLDGGHVAPRQTNWTGLLTAEAAATVLSVDPQWLLRQAREARIPHVRIGKLVRFDPAAIAEQCAGPAATATPATSFGQCTKTPKGSR
jgi:hypothetical protein